MVVYKFGGASVKNAERVKNLKDIIVQNQEARVVVLSAFGKTTNQLEELAAHIDRRDEPGFVEKLEEIRRYHDEVISGLLLPDDPVHGYIEEIFARIRQSFDMECSDYDFLYDQVVSFGELLSTVVVSAYLVREGLNCRYVDIRKVLITDDLFREANIVWPSAELFVKEHLSPGEGEMVLTQGFIGGTPDGWSTTLGREGSDYTAAVIANILEAERLVIWKDVPGVLNADPRYFSHTEKLDRISYQEAIELAYYGAKIIHPKTIKPLQNKDIPLYVQSFVEPEKEGTCITQDGHYDGDKPIFILKTDQMLLSILPRDFSFVVEEQLSRIYGLFARHRIKINIMQNSALNFTACVDNNSTRIPGLISDLSKHYRVLYNRGLELITVRHYTEQVLRDIQQGRHVLVEQRSRHTAQFLMGV